MEAIILNLLKTKFQGVSDTILKGLAEKAARTIADEEAAKTYTEGLTIQNIIDSYADSRATQATKTAVQNYEKKYSLKDGKPSQADPQPNPQPNPQPDPHADQTPAWAKALIEANQKLTEKVAAMEQGKVTATRAAQLQEAIKDLTPTEQKAYNRIDVASMTDEVFTATMAEIGQEVKQLVADRRAASAVNRAPMRSAGSIETGKEASDEEVKAMMGIK